MVLMYAHSLALPPFFRPLSFRLSRHSLQVPLITDFRPGQDNHRHNHVSKLISQPAATELPLVCPRKPRELSYFSLAFPLYPLVKTRLPTSRNRCPRRLWLASCLFARLLCGIAVHVVSLSLFLLTSILPSFPLSRQVFPLRRRIFSHYLAAFLSTLRRDILQCLAAHVWRQFSVVGPLDLLK